MRMILRDVLLTLREGDGVALRSDIRDAFASSEANERAALGALVDAERAGLVQSERRPDGDRALVITAAGDDALDEAILVEGILEKLLEVDDAVPVFRLADTLGEDVEAVEREVATMARERWVELLPDGAVRLTERGRRKVL